MRSQILHIPRIKDGLNGFIPGRNKMQHGVWRKRIARNCAKAVLHLQSLRSGSAA